MYISCRAQSELDFDALVTDLQRAFPDSIQISDDYYADRLERCLDIARENGWPPDSAPIQCLKRVGAEHGIQRHLAIRISDKCSIDARIDKKGAFLVTHDLSNIADAEPVLLILRKYPLAIETG
jgi:hypothetical protein